VLINIVKCVEQLAGVDQRVYWCESTLFKLADEAMGVKLVESQNQINEI
jgi:hypothetical protein